MRRRLGWRVRRLTLVAVALPIALVMVTPAFAIGLLAIIIWILVTSILLWVRASDSPPRGRDARATAHLSRRYRELETAAAMTVTCN